MLKSGRRASGFVQVGLQPFISLLKASPGTEQYHSMNSLIA
jgi:hypothetical protein